MHKGIANTRQKYINDPQKKYRLGTVIKNILLEGLNQFHGANLTLDSDVDPGHIWESDKTQHTRQPIGQPSPPFCNIIKAFSSVTLMVTRSIPL